MAGWIWIHDGDWKLAVEDWKFFGKTMPELTDLPGDTRIAFDLGYRKRSLQIIGVLFDDEDDYEDFQEDLDEWNNDGAFEIKIQIHSDGRFLKQFGVAESLNYLYIDTSDGTKITRGDEQKYRIGRILFKQG